MSDKLTDGGELSNARRLSLQSMNTFVFESFVQLGDGTKLIDPYGEHDGTVGFVLAIIGTRWCRGSDTRH